MCKKKTCAISISPVIKCGSCLTHKGIHSVDFFIQAEVSRYDLSQSCSPEKKSFIIHNPLKIEHFWI